MTPYLLLDFGTTSTKSTLVDLDTGTFAHLQRHPAIPSAPVPPGRCEIPLDSIRSRFLQICSSYYELAPFRASSLDETLLGLRTLALIADGRAGDYLEAQQLFGRECRVRERGARSER